MLVRPRQNTTLTGADLLPPDLAAWLDGLDVLSRQVLAGKLQGERRSKRRGRSVEFDDYRPYTAGDDLRHIDWNVFARLDRFFLKIFQEEEDLSVHVVLDCSASMLAGEPPKLLAAARLASAIAYIALVNNNRVQVACLGLPPTMPSVTASGLFRLEPLRARRSVPRVIEALCNAVNAAQTDSNSSGPRSSTPADFTASLRTLAMARAGRGVVIILSDLLIPGSNDAPGYAEGLKFFAGSAGYDTLIVQTLAPGELDPAKETSGSSNRAALTGDMRLLDAETGQGREVTITAPLLNSYRRAAQKFIEAAASFCTTRGMRHALLTSDADVPSFVLSILRRRGFVG